jgi:hypothetical protein
MVAMGADELDTHGINVDVLSLDEFYVTLQKRIEDVGRALFALRMPPGSEPPRLGAFVDAGTTAARHQVLREEFLVRLGQLHGALTTAQLATARIVDGYRTVEELNELDMERFPALLRADGSTRGGGATDA